MLNIYHDDDGKQKHQSHEILMDDIYVDYTGGDIGGQIDISIMAWGEDREESIKNFFAARNRVVEILKDKIDILSKLEEVTIKEKYPNRA